MVFVALQRLEGDAQSFGRSLDRAFDGGEDGGCENGAAIFGAKDEMRMEERDGMAVSAVGFFHKGVPVSIGYFGG